jgi:ribosome-associated translation inhibitor RaiA
MKTSLQFFGAKPRLVWRNQVEEQIKRLAAFAAISAANVAVEQRHESKPHFCMRVLLAVPGPDIHAEAREHTFQAALLKVIRELLRQIQIRRTNQLRGRHRQHLRNWPGTPAGHRA